MYKVYLDDSILYYPGDEEAVILAPEIHLSLNDSGSFECGVPDTNPLYDKFKNRSSMVTVYQEEKEIFCGEVRTCEKDFDNTRQVSCTGELAFLFDSVQRPAKHQNLGLRQMLETFLNIHNSQVEDKKKFRVGIVTIQNPDVQSMCITNYETTLDCIRDLLVEPYGGYLKIRKSGNLKYLDWVSLNDYGKICEQKIKFGVNLMEYSENTSAEDVATGVIPLGEKLEEGPIESLDAYLDIKSVNGGLDYLYLPEAVDRYGWVIKTVNFDGVSIASNLKKRGEKWLKDAQYETMVLELTAVDLSVMNARFDSFELGDSVQAIAKPYGMDRFFPVQELTIYLQEPDKNQLVLGNTMKKSFTQQSSDANKDLHKELERVHETSNFLQDAIDNATQMLTGTKGGYRLDEFDEENRFLRTLYMNAPSKEGATNVLQIGPQGIGFSRTGYVGPYKSAWTLDGVLLGEFIKAGSVQAESLSTEYRTSVEKQITDGDSGTKEWAQSTITTSVKAAADRITLRVDEEIKRATGAEENLSSSITLNTQQIESKVGKNEFESYVTQYYDRVIFGFNNKSKYIQITENEIGIYNNGISRSQKRVAFDQNGNHFWRDDYYVGKIGTNYVDSNYTYKGLSFDLEVRGKYMAWAYRNSEAERVYSVAFAFFKEAYVDNNKYPGLYLGHDMYTDGYTISIDKEGEVYSKSYLGAAGFKLSSKKFVITNSRDEEVFWADQNSCGGSWVSLSDSRLKSNINQSKTDALDVLSSIPYKSFNWIASGERQELGVIAQDLEVLAPELVLTREDGTKCINHTRLIFYCMKAIQQLGSKKTVKRSTPQDALEKNYTEAEKLRFIGDTALVEEEPIVRTITDRSRREKYDE